MISEIAGGNLLAIALKQPLADIYNAAKGSAKEKLKWLKQNTAVERLYGRISEVGTTRTIASKHPVSIRSIYYPAKIRTRHSPMAINTANDLSDGVNQHIVITGTVGQGKSVFLKYLCIREIETGNGVPVFLELRNASETKSLRTLINNQLVHLGFESDSDDSHLDLLFSRRLVTLFLDGYDEVKKSVAASVRDEIHLLASKYPSLRIVVTSRPSAISQELDRLTGFSYLEINPLQTSDFDPFLKKIGVNKDTRLRLLAAIEKSQTEIRELLTTPLMLTLVVTACGTRPSLPDTLPDFYDALFGVMVATHDETKPGYIREKATKLTNAQLENLFKAFCFVSKEEAGTTSLTPKEFSSSHSRALNVTDLECTAEAFKTDLVDVVCLMAKDGLNVAFIHKSIQEYFASAFIADLDDDQVVKAIYEGMRGGPYKEWTQELLFLRATDSHRCNKFYHLPMLKDLLAIFNYSKLKRNGATLADIRTGISKLSPSISLNEEEDELVVSLPVNTISHYGIREYVFDVFTGVGSFFEQTSSGSQNEKSSYQNMEYNGELKDHLAANAPYGKEACELIRNNLKKLYEEQVYIENMLKDRKERLLSIVMAKKKNR